MSRFLACALVLGSISQAAPAQLDANARPIIPLCPGLTIVTAINAQHGDYESIKFIESVAKENVRIRYSGYRPDPKGDYDSDTTPHPPWLPFTTHRTVRTVDLESAQRYLQHFTSGDVVDTSVSRRVDASATRNRRGRPQISPLQIPELVRGTTAVGMSRKSFRELRDRGKTPFAIFQGFSELSSIDEDGNPVSALKPFLDGASRSDGELTRVDPTPVMVPVLVNNRLVKLPALRARGKFGQDDSEFLFLMDETNPLTLHFRIGIRRAPTAEEKKMWAGTENTPEYKKAFVGARDNLQVIKISHSCASADLEAFDQGLKAKGVPVATSSPKAGPAGAGSVGGSGAPAGGGTRGGAAAAGAATGTGAGGASGGAAARGGATTTLGTGIEESLARTGRADVYSIYFDFNSDKIRPESEQTLEEIAGVLRRHPEWKLSIEGHTDSIASDGFNLTLSQQRAASVKNALVAGKGIAAPRLTTSGYGESRPKATNDTQEGRAQNRRVELVRLP